MCGMSPGSIMIRPPGTVWWAWVRIVWPDVSDGAKQVGDDCVLPAQVKVAHIGFVVGYSRIAAACQREHVRTLVEAGDIGVAEFKQGVLIQAGAGSHHEDAT